MRPYIRCAYCGLLTQDLDHDLGCTWDGLNAIGEPEHCYACGKAGQSYSPSQWTKDHPRCKACVGANKTTRHQPYYFEAFKNHPFFDGAFQALRSACFMGEYDTVLELLDQGVNPHIVPVKTATNLDRSCWGPHHASGGIPLPYILCDKSGNVLEDRNEDEPYTLLRACVFGIANILLEEENRWAMAKIASLLVERGMEHDKEDARTYFVSRYGDFTYTEHDNEESPFKALYDVLSK